MLAFRSEGHVQAWLERTGEPFGALIDFETMWRLARLWYAGRMDEAWRGRSAEEAEAVFRACGLEGEFWRMG